MLDHTGFAVADFERSKVFYAKALPRRSRHFPLLSSSSNSRTGGRRCARGIWRGQQTVLSDWRWRSCCWTDPRRIHRATLPVPAALSAR